MNCRGLLESFRTQGKIIEECQRRDAIGQYLELRKTLTVPPSVVHQYNDHIVL